MKRKPYPSDLTDEQWDVLACLLPSAKTGGRPRTVDLREVVNGIVYVLRNGCTWRAMPHDLPPWGTVWWYFREWRQDGTWERVHEALRPKVRKAEGSNPTPSAAGDELLVAELRHVGECVQSRPPQLQRLYVHVSNPAGPPAEKGRVGWGPGRAGFKPAPTYGWLIRLFP